MVCVIIVKGTQIASRCFEMKKKYVVVDLETTGNDPKQGDRIIQIAAVVIENGSISYQYTSYVNPKRDIPEFIQELTGITDADVAHAPTFQELAPYIIGVLDDAIFVAHNVLFDLSFLQAELERVGYEKFLGSTVDTVEMAKIISPQLDSYKLESLGKVYGFTHDRPHQADSDAYVTALLFLEFYQNFMRLPKPTIKSLYRLSYSLKSELKEVFAEILQEYSTNCEPWRPDLDIYRGIALVNGQEKIHRECKPNKNKEVNYTEFSQTDRETYTFMMESMRRGHITLLEDGTKNIAAHLKAAVTFLNHSSNQMVISVHTNHLLDEYRNHLISEAFDRVKWVEMKSAGDYLSLPKFEQIVRKRDHNYESAITKMQILVWLTWTTTGNSAELNLSTGGKVFWNEVEHHAALHPKLLKPWTERDFYLRQKRLAQTADIILTTDDCLIAELDHNETILNTSNHLLIEEADYFPHTIHKYLGDELSYAEVRNILNKLGTLENRHTLLQAYMLTCEKSQCSLDKKELNRIVLNVSSKVEDFFTELTNYGINQREEAGNQELFKYQLSEEKTGQIPARIYFEAEKVYEAFGQITRMIQQLQAYLRNVPIEKWKRSQINTIDDLGKIKIELTRIYKMFFRMFIQINPAEVVWMEWNRKGNKNSIRIVVRPVNITDWIQNKLTTENSLLFVSDILTIAHSFDWFKEILGMRDEDVQKRIIKTNNKNHIFLLSTQKKMDGGYALRVAKILKNLVKRGSRKHIVLFHSTDSIKDAYLELKNDSTLQDIFIQAQGISSGSHMKMLRNHAAAHDSILMMTYSVWDQIRQSFIGDSTILIIGLPKLFPDSLTHAIYENKLHETLHSIRRMADTSCRSIHEWIIVLGPEDQIDEAKLGESLYPHHFEMISDYQYFKKFPVE